MTRKSSLKVGILSLGCPRNLVDSESILGRIRAKGYPVVDIGKADIGIVNTCAFIQDAKRESVEAILDLVELKKEGKLKSVVVCGCLAERYREKLRKELPEVDAFIGRISLNHTRHNFSLTPKHYAYLKICEGCINRCSYCVIPAIKGRFKSLKIESVLERVKELDKMGVSELNIVGQDTSGYGLDTYGEKRLAQLLKRIAKTIKHINWVRLLYLYPNRITDELLEVIGDTPQICKYVDLPVQHINERILKLMRRNTTKKGILRLIAKIRKKIPGVALRTSLIVGFPSETEREFNELLTFIDEVRFERLGAFIYSREEDTPAYYLRKQIPERVKIQRLDSLMQKQQMISRDINAGFLGKTMKVLIDEERSDYWQGSRQLGHVYLARTQYDAPEVDGTVFVDAARKLHPGEFVNVRIADTLEYDLAGEAL